MAKMLSPRLLLVRCPRMLLPIFQEYNFNFPHPPNFAFLKLFLSGANKFGESKTIGQAGQHPLKERRENKSNCEHFSKLKM